MSKQLIFVYNTDSGASNAVVDFAHRLIRPSTYPCKLCVVTYGPYVMKRDWKRFIRQTGLPAVFLHRDEFVKKRQFADYKVDLPAVILKDGCIRKTLLSGRDFERLKNLDDLTRELKNKLNNLPETTR